MDQIVILSKGFTCDLFLRRIQTLRYDEIVYKFEFEIKVFVSSL